MTKQEILEKAIQKAVASGWTPKQGYDLERGYYKDTIFSHDFAKALWGEETPDPLIIKCREFGTVHPAWEAHLMHMVIADDPIAYLGEHLED